MGKPYNRPLVPLIPPVFTKEEVLENEYIAGLSDSDGYIQVVGNRCHFEVAQASWNIHLLEFLQSKFGGRVWKPNRDVANNTHYFKVSTKEAMIKLAFMLNGNVRATSRNEQFQRLCTLLNIVYIPPVKLTEKSGWFAGMFDGDGSIAFRFDKKRYTLVKVCSKYPADVSFFLDSFSGRVVKHSSNASNWVIYSKKEIVTFCDYLKSVPLRSSKKIRVDLVKDYYNLSKKRPLEKGSPYYQDWLDMEQKWYQNGADIYRKNCTGRPHTSKARMERDTGAKDENDE